MLTSVVHQYPFGNGWLTMKVALLVVYIVLGSVALKRGRTRRIRVAAFAAALLTVGFLVTVARAHHPLGHFRRPGRLTGTRHTEPGVAVDRASRHHARW